MKIRHLLFSLVAFGALLMIVPAPAHAMNQCARLTNQLHASFVENSAVRTTLRDSMSMDEYANRPPQTQERFRAYNAQMERTMETQTRLYTQLRQANCDPVETERQLQILAVQANGDTPGARPLDRIRRSIATLCYEASYSLALFAPMNSAGLPLENQRILTLTRNHLTAQGQFYHCF